MGPLGLQWVPLWWAEVSAPAGMGTKGQSPTQSHGGAAAAPPCCGSAPQLSLLCSEDWSAHLPVGVGIFVSLHRSLLLFGIFSPCSESEENTKCVL